MPEPLSAVVPRPAGERRVPLRVDPLDLSAASPALAENCSALALCLRESDLEAAERLFAFIVDQSPDRRSAITGALAPILLETDNAASHDLIKHLRRPVSTVGAQGVCMHGPEDGPLRTMLELTALLLDDAHVPVHLRFGEDIDAVVRASSTGSVAALALGATTPRQAQDTELSVRQLRRAGVAVVLVADPEHVPPDVGRVVGAAAVAWQPGEVADELLRLRGPLSRGEAEVLRLAADGYTNVRIAHELGISLSAVKARLEGSYAKLRAADRTHAVAVALRQRWIQ